MDIPCIARLDPDTARCGGVLPANDIGFVMGTIIEGDNLLIVGLELLKM